ncbi:MAG: hypothetical protein ACI35R_16390, partial [Bacillus sp. (in: firmicutes)]
SRTLPGYRGRSTEWLVFFCLDVETSIVKKIETSRTYYHMLGFSNELSCHWQPFSQRKLLRQSPV